MTGSSIPEFDLPLEPTSYPPCSSETRGLVFNVLQCVDHDHFIHFTSQGTFVLNAAGDITITTATNIDIDAINVNMDAELFIPVVSPVPATKAECVENGIIDVNKLLTYYLNNT
ncbi:MAG: hypothetical protein H6937_11575 [Burkholderiales bacterium]|nr:hypothetical protein [Burkholderiales bacterium]